jgi:hypothetical protein
MFVRAVKDFNFMFTKIEKATNPPTIRSFKINLHSLLAGGLN